jgi:hypothetical protein
MAQGQTHTMAAERAALRHADRKSAREQVGEAAATHKGTGAGQGMMGGSGMGSGDCTQAAETTRSGDMRGSGGMMPGGMR